MAVRRWWLVSDLHLGSSEAEDRGTATAFPQFLEAVVAAEPGEPGESALVLLGDTLETQGLGDQARERIEALAASHPRVFAALRACVEHGVRVEVVTGNHDLDLARPAAAGRLRELLGDVDGAGGVDGGGVGGVRGGPDGADSPRVRVLPWALHVPGVLFAEHGHQHHAVHRLPTLLLAAGGDDARLAPSALSVWSAHSGGLVRRSAGAARALLAARAAERRSRAPGFRALVTAESARIGLRGDVGWALWSISQLRIAPAVVGTLGRVVRRRVAPGRQRVGGPPPAAAQVAATLAAHGTPVHWYVTGHTHRAASGRLPGRDTGWLNTGTWCGDIRGPGPDRDDPRHYPYVLVEVDDRGTTSARLEYWRAPVEPGLDRGPERAATAG